jgi:hypothetical protein
MSAGRQPRSAVAFRGIPNDRIVLGRIGPKGVPVLQWPGELDLPALRDPVMARAWPEVMHDPARPLALPARLEAVVNLCASAELYPPALLALDAALQPGIAVLNHPRAVMWTRRDMASQALAGIPFLQVPNVRRFQPEAPRDFMAAFEAGAFHYPVVLQPAAAGEGVERHVIAHPGDWALVFRAPWADRAWIIRQEQHSRSPWRMRIGMAGQAAHVEVYLEGALPGGQPPAIAGDSVRALIGAVRQCIPLDVATVVLALEADRPVFERIDPGLPVPITDDAPAFVRASSQRVRTALAAPLAALVRDVALWRTDAWRLPRLQASASHALEGG